MQSPSVTIWQPCKDPQNLGSFTKQGGVSMLCSHNTAPWTPEVQEKQHTLSP